METKFKTLLALAAGLLWADAHAADVKVLTAGAFKPVVLALVPEFEKATGHKVTVENDTAGALQKRIAGARLLMSACWARAPWTSSSRPARWRRAAPCGWPGWPSAWR